MRPSQRSTSRRRLLQQGLATGSGLLAAAALPRKLAAAAEGGPSPARNETLKTIASLRTIHGDFSDRPVPDETVQTILDASVRAASASAMQSYSIVVVRDSATMAKLVGYRGSCLLLYCVDFTRFVDCAARLGDHYSPGGILSFITGSTNTILAAQTAVIAAKSLGVDSLLTNGVHRGDMQRLWEILGLPEKYCFPLIALVLGYAANEPAFQKGRLTGPSVIHPGRFQRADAAQTDAIIREYDDKARHLGLVEDWDQKGHKHYMDWLFKDWLSGVDPAKSPEKVMQQFIRRSGLLEG